ncbi:MAG TPA: amino acid adenylation domain-containing protein [Ktedonosporobacter sp.]|nr:amino acid adenylation domain-containing protein [Ktedonosporobacter sp.]
MIPKKQSVISFGEQLNRPGVLNSASALQQPSATQALIQESHETQAHIEHASCIHHLFEAQVEHTPDALALTVNHQHLTYRDLNSYANQVAHYLRMQGVRPGVCVGICLERSVEMVVSILGVLKAGGAYLPLDPAYPAERLAFMLQDAQVKVLLMQQHYVERLPIQNIPVISFEHAQPAIAQQQTGNPTSEVTLHDVAYIVYTSGSTGQPKGVMVEHYGLSNMILAQIRTFGLQPHDRAGQFASFSFDASVSEVFMTLLSGAHLYLIPQEWRWPAARLQQFLQEQAITIVTLPPSALALLRPETLPLLRIVISAGEELSAEIARCWSRGRYLFNAYGPTEGTVCTTIGRYHMLTGRPSIGHPIANVQVYLLDAALQPVSAGMIGEIYIGGMGLARGYFNRPDLTAEKFLPHPFSVEPGARLYKTGDLARYLPDGAIECIGRMDRMVKVRGFRIELGEVEAVLEQHPLVAKSLVMVYKDASKRKRLVAYVLPDPQYEEYASSRARTLASLQEELVRFLQEKLPTYMRPALFIILDDFPLTPNGKIDHHMLPSISNHT